MILVPHLCCPIWVTCYHHLCKVKYFYGEEYYTHLLYKYLVFPVDRKNLLQLCKYRKEKHYKCNAKKCRNGTSKSMQARCEGNCTKPHPYIFFTLEHNWSGKWRRDGAFTCYFCDLDVYNLVLLMASFPCLATRNLSLAGKWLVWIKSIASNSLSIFAESAGFCSVGHICWPLKCNITY